MCVVPVCVVYALERPALYALQPPPLSAPPLMFHACQCSAASCFEVDSMALWMAQASLHIPCGPWAMINGVETGHPICMENVMRT